MDAQVRLARLLDEKDAEVESLRRKIQEMEDEDEQTWKWARHRKIDVDDRALHLPRLELRCRNLGDWYNWEWTYCLVYKHFLGHVVFVPLGMTKVGGSGRPPMRGPDMKEIDLPFRDGAHIKSDSAHLGLPAFAIIDELVKVIDAKESCAWKEEGETCHAER